MRLFSPLKTRLYIAIPVMLCAFFGMFQATKIGIADIQAYKARYLLSQWEEGQRLPTDDEVVRALDSASSALGWAPNNTEYMDLKAHILTYKGLLYWESLPFAAVTEEAVAFYLQSTQIRPKWPYAWARLALLKAHRGEFDGEYQTALLRAVEYGPWERNVQKTIAEAGLYGWTQLEEASRDALIATIQRGLNVQFKTMANIVMRHHRKVFVCAYLARNEKTKTFCGW